MNTRARILMTCLLVLGLSISPSYQPPKPRR